MAFNYKEMTPRQIKEFTLQYQQDWTVFRGQPISIPKHTPRVETRYIPSHDVYEITYDLAKPPIVISAEVSAALNQRVQQYFQLHMERAYEAAMHGVSIDTIDKVNTLFDRIPTNES